MTEEKLNEFLDFLATHGWKIEKKQTPLHLNEAVRQRYANIPRDYEMFMSRVAVASAPGDQAGFWGGDDYNDPYEKDTISPWWFEGFCMEDDSGASEEERERIRSFWDEHFPIALAVHSDYTCLSISVRPEDFGSVLHTMFLSHDEDGGGTKVSNSFEELLDRMRRLIEKGEPRDEDWEIDVWDFV